MTRVAVKRAAPMLLVGLTLLACDGDLLGPRHRPRATELAEMRAPSASLVASPSSSTQISVWWTDNVPNEDGWELSRSTTGATGTFTVIVSLPANSTYYSDSGLIPEKEYCYKVRSFRKPGPNTAFNEYLNIACTTTPPLPPPPTNVSAAFGDNPWVEVTWTSPSSPANLLRVQRSSTVDGPWTAIADVNASATAYTDQNVASEQLYCYRVTSINLNGENPSSADCTVRPSAPSNPVAVARDAQTVLISWTDNSSFELQYELQRSLDTYAAQTIASVAANVTTYVDAGLTSNTRYWYRVRARSADATSPYSAWTSALPASAPPAAPSTDYVYPTCSTCVVAAGMVSTGTEGIRIQRSSGAGDWSVIDSHPIYQSNWYIQETDRITEQQVCYRAIAYNSVGDSPPSNERCTAPPAAPTDPYVVGLADGSLEIHWTNHSAVADGFLVATYFIDYSGQSCDGFVCRVDQYYTVSDPAVTKFVVPGSETPWYVCATKDGGCSDAAVINEAPYVPIGNTVTPTLERRLPEPLRALLKHGSTKRRLR